MLSLDLMAEERKHRREDIEAATPVETAAHATQKLAPH
jgi:hypothetical protein